MAERVAPRPTANIAARTADRLLLQHAGAHASGPPRPHPPWPPTLGRTRARSLFLCGCLLPDWPMCHCWRTETFLRKRRASSRAGGTNLPVFDGICRLSATPRRLGDGVYARAGERLRRPSLYEHASRQYGHGAVGSRAGQYRAGCAWRRRRAPAYRQQPRRKCRSE